ncbi:ABC transporter permease [Nocardiopsis sp. CC223A]|uniref:ABC transporter permease n=1 Tax=Nocardiopsis sp. CC223A TaxID=3044051 RepID=UPI00278C42C2|nr:ABC transporter permease [Nocardiopsis sp. CC223A]
MTPAPVVERPAGPRRALSDLAAAVSAEWVRLRSVRTTWWGAAAALALMCAVAPSVAVSTVSNAQNGTVPVAQVPAAEMAVYATLWVVQFVVIGLVLPVVTTEYSSGAVRASLQAVPVRWRLLAAKAVVTAGFAFVLGAVAASAGTVLAFAVMSHPYLAGYGTLEAGAAVVSVLRQGAYLALVAVTALGAGAALRSVAGALTALFLLVVGLPVMLLMMGGDTSVFWSERTLFVAGAAFMDTDLALGPVGIGPFSAGVVILCWSAAASAVGALVLARRDA